MAGAPLPNSRGQGPRVIEVHLPKTRFGSRFAEGRAKGAENVITLELWSPVRDMCEVDDHLLEARRTSPLLEWASSDQDDLGVARTAHNALHHFATNEARGAADQASGGHVKTSRRGPRGLRPETRPRPGRVCDRARRRPLVRCTSAWPGTTPAPARQSRPVPGRVGDTTRPPPLPTGSTEWSLM